MKARPVLFSDPMVRALLDGRKTQTRRVVKLRLPEPWMIYGEKEDGSPWPFWMNEYGDYHELPCPYGQPGDLLYVKETCRAEEGEETLIDGVRYRADNVFIAIENTQEAAERWGKLRGPGGPETPLRWRPSIHMPRWASRLTLRLSDVRVERLRKIIDSDARAEGYEHAAAFLSGDWVHSLKDANPRVWALTFDVLRANVEDVT